MQSTLQNTDSLQSLTIQLCMHSQFMWSWTEYEFPFVEMTFFLVSCHSLSLISAYFLQVFFKMDKSGDGQEVCLGDLSSNRGLSFVGFTPDMLLEVILCSFLKVLIGHCLESLSMSILRYNSSYPTSIYHSWFWIRVEKCTCTAASLLDWSVAIIVNSGQPKLDDFSSLDDISCDYVINTAFHWIWLT